MALKLYTVCALFLPKQCVLEITLLVERVGFSSFWMHSILLSG